MAKSPIIVFDLDGTLVDTAPDLVAAVNYVLAREGLPPLPFESARKMIGSGARALIERGLEQELEHGQILPGDVQGEGIGAHRTGFEHLLLAPDGIKANDRA